MALQQLNVALQSLSKSVSNFNIGAISINDFKPIEERIKDMRQILKMQKAHYLLLHSKHNSHSVRERPRDDINATISRLHDEVANLRIINTAITLSLYSCSTDDIMCKNKSSSEFKKQVEGCMSRLCVLNDSLISLHISMEKALKKELNLKIDCQKSLFEYRVFLREQKDIRDKKLEETNPTIVNTKKKLEKKIEKINIMKRLMTNMIATAGKIISKERFLFEMMKKHRDVINLETIIEMARDTPALNQS